MREDRRCLFMSSPLDCSVLKPYFSLSVSRLSNSRSCCLTKLLRFSGKWSLMACHGVSGQRLVKSTGSPTFLFHHCQLLVDLRQISNSSGHTWPLLLKAVPQSLSTIGSKFQFLASTSLFLPNMDIVVVVVYKVIISTNIVLKSWQLKSFVWSGMISRTLCRCLLEN